MLRKKKIKQSNIIEFNSLKTAHVLEGTECGNITISVFSDKNTKCNFYYILPDNKELLPLVDLLEAVLTNSSFHIQSQ